MVFHFTRQTVPLLNCVTLTCLALPVIDCLTAPLPNCVTLTCLTLPVIDCLTAPLLNCVTLLLLQSLALPLPHHSTLFLLCYPAHHLLHHSTLPATLLVREALLRQLVWRPHQAAGLASSPPCPVCMEHQQELKEEIQF